MITVLILGNIVIGLVGDFWYDFVCFCWCLMEDAGNFAMFELSLEKCCRL